MDSKGPRPMGNNAQPSLPGYVRIYPVGFPMTTFEAGTMRLLRLSPEMPSLLFHR